MTPLEQLYQDLGTPAWFWPVVLIGLLLIFVFAGGLIE